MINVNRIWKDGLRLTKDGRAVLANYILKYLKFYEGNIDFNVLGQNLTD